MLTYKQQSNLTFINLSNHTFGEYIFGFRINDGYSIKELSTIHSKHQLLFQKIESKNQQLNLMFVDSVFPNILADLTLEVFINDIGSFNQYSNSKSKIKLVPEKDESRYFKYKFFSFIHMLLYSDIASHTVFKGNEFSDRVYCLKNGIGELEYFSIYEQTGLQENLLNTLKLKIDLASSTLSKLEVKLCLKLVYENTQKLAIA